MALSRLRYRSAALALLLISSSCRWIAGYDDLPADTDGGGDLQQPVFDASSDRLNVDGDSANADGGGVLTVEGTLSHLGPGHSPVITGHGDGAAIAFISPDAVRVFQSATDPAGLTNPVNYPGVARTPAITSHDGRLFVAWAEQSDSGAVIGLRVAQGFGAATTLSSGRHDSPRFFSADGRLHMLGSVDASSNSDPCVAHTKMLQASFDGAQWSAVQVVYPPQNSWSAFLPRPIACATTCAPASHGLLWVYSNDGDTADGNGGASILSASSQLVLRFTPVMPNQIPAASEHTTISTALPYDCTTPHLPRRRPAALDSDGKIFVAYSDWVPGNAQTGVRLGTLVPTGPTTTTNTLVRTDSLFPQLLLLDDPATGESHRLLIFTHEDNEVHTIMARFFDENGALLGEQIALHSLGPGYALQSLDAAVLAGGQLGIVFSEENMLAGAAMPVRNTHFFRVSFDVSRFEP